MERGMWVEYVFLKGTVFNGIFNKIIPKTNDNESTRLRVREDVL